jgi:hypothetical protein
VTVVAATRRSDGDRLWAAGIAVAAAVVLALTAGQLIDFWAYNLRVAALNSATDSSVFTWFGGLAMLVAAVSFSVLAVRVPELRRTCVALAALFAFLLVDNRTQLHHRLPHGTALLLPVLAVVLVLLLRVGRVAPRRIERLLQAAVICLAVSLVVHVLGPPALAAVGWHSGDWQYQIKIAVKEGTELAGWILACFGALGLARSARRRRQDQPAAVTDLV